MSREHKANRKDVAAGEPFYESLDSVPVTSPYRARASRRLSHGLDFWMQNIHSIPKSKFKIKKKNNAKVSLPEDMMEMIKKIKKKKDDF